MLFGYISHFAFRRTAGLLVARRFITTNTRQAFLEPIASHTGVTCLALNRPQTKNAISLKLLEEFGECLDHVQFDKT